jgi:hypothetical protein
MAHLTSGLIGPSVSTTTTDQNIQLGTRSIGTDGTVWVYVQASGAITQYDCVAIDENYQAATVTSALAGAGHTPGFAQVAFADNEYGWVALEGSNISVRANISCAADALLYVGCTAISAGVVDDASVTGRVTLQGVVLVTAGGTTVQAREVIAVSPQFTNV